MSKLRGGAQPNLLPPGIRSSRALASSRRERGLRAVGARAKISFGARGAPFSSRLNHRDEISHPSPSSPIIPFIPISFAALPSAKFFRARFFFRLPATRVSQITAPPSLGLRARDQTSRLARCALRVRVPPNEGSDRGSVVERRGNPEELVRFQPVAPTRNG